MSLCRNALQIVMIAFSTLGSISLAATYTVRPGETLYGIARAFGSSVAELQRLNKLETPVVKVGQVLVVPETTAAKPGLPVSHQVAAGETLYAIARKYAVDLETLQRLNKLESPVVKVGQVLLIPSVVKPSVVGPEVKPVMTVKPTVSIKPIETKPIETKPGSSKPKPVEPNKPAQTPTLSPKPSQPAPKPDLKPVQLGSSSASGKPVRAVAVGKFVLDPGSSRVLPTMPVPLMTPENVNTSPWPNLDGAPGQPKASEPEVMTPAVPEVGPTAPSNNSANNPAGATRIPIKVVQTAPLPDFGPITNPDSSTDGISPTHSTDPDEAVVSTTGPISAVGAIEHTVVYGDSLYRISVKYGVAVQAIKAANNLSSDSLSVGQILNIPGENVVGSVIPPSSGVTTGVGVRGIAERYLGVTYVFGGTTPSGLDCSGLVYVVYHELGLQLPRTSRLQYQVGEEVAREDLREGDLVFFDTTGQGVSHVGIYLSDGDFINAASNPGKVLISNLSESYWDKRYLGARRVMRSPISDQPGEDVQP